MDVTMIKKADLHMHSVYSDGTDGPEKLIAAAANAGLDLFSLTDHDSLSGCGAVAEALKPGDPAFINGIELLCRDEGGKYHILGYGYDLDGESICRTADATHIARIHKVAYRLDYLKEKYGFTFTPEERAEIFTNLNPGKPHIAQLMVRRGYARDTRHAFELMAGYKGFSKYLTPEEVVSAILGSGGIPVLAHAVFGEGDRYLDDEETERRVKMLKGYGLMGLECFYSSFSARDTAFMLSLAEKYGLLVTAGSDYHGKNKTVICGDNGGADNSKLIPFYEAVSDKIFKK